MRDRLSQLIFNKLSETCRECSSLECTEELTDYLLANGVIVPPCKVGDTVYKLFPPYCHKREEDKCDHYCDGYDTTCEEYEGVYEIYDVSFKLGMLDDFGKRVFLTKEEAEAALKGGAE